MPGAGEAIFGVSLIVGALIIAAIPVIKMVGWILDGGVDAGPALVGVFLYLALIAAVMSAPGPLKVVPLVVIIVGAILMPMLGQVSDNLQIARMDDQKMAQMGMLLEREPDNAPIRMEFARMLRKRGELDRAIEHMQWVLSRHPRLNYHVKAEMDTWIRERDRRGTPSLIFCHQCRAENPWNAAHCMECGAAFGTLAGMEQRIQHDGGLKRVVRGWLIIGITTNLVIFTIILGRAFLPIEVIGVFIISMVIVGGWLFLRWVGGDLGKVVE